MNVSETIMINQRQLPKLCYNRFTHYSQLKHVAAQTHYIETSLDNILTISEMLHPLKTNKQKLFVIVKHLTCFGTVLFVIF